MQRYVFVFLIRFRAVSWIQGCFHWLSSPIRQELRLIKGLPGTVVAGAGVKGNFLPSRVAITHNLFLEGSRNLRRLTPSCAGLNDGNVLRRGEDDVQRKALNLKSERIRGKGEDHGRHGGHMYRDLRDWVAEGRLS